MTRSIPCGWSSGVNIAMRSTTFTTRICSPGAVVRSSQVAASVSRVGMSPAQAMTTSGSPSSLLAHSQTEAPRSQWPFADWRSRYWSCGCLSMTMTLTWFEVRKQWSAVQRRQLASGGR